MARGRTSVLGELARGVRALLGGVAFFARTPSTWGWALVPAAIAVIVAGALSAAGLWGVLRIGALVVGSGGALAAVGRFVLDLALGALVVYVAVVVALAVAQPLARPALERVVRRLEDRAGARAPTAMPSSGVGTSLAVAAGALGITLPTIGALEGLTLVLPESAFVTEPVVFLVSGLALAWDLLDHPLSRRGVGLGARLTWMRANWAAVLGFALAAQALLLVPGVDLFFLPIGIVGATRLVAEAISPSSRR